MNDFKSRRLLSGISQSELAARVGCNQTTIGRIENGAEASEVLMRAIDAALPKSSAAHGVDAPAKPVDLSESAATVAEKIRLMNEIIESQRQTIDAQKLTISALTKRVQTAAAPPACGAGDGPRCDERKKA